MREQIFLQAYQDGFLSECISGCLLVTKCRRYVCHFRPHNLAPTIENEVGAHYCNGRDVLQKFFSLIDFWQNLWMWASLVFAWMFTEYELKVFACIRYQYLKAISIAMILWMLYLLLVKYEESWEYQQDIEEPYSKHSHRLKHQVLPNWDATVEVKSLISAGVVSSSDGRMSCKLKTWIQVPANTFWAGEIGNPG